MTTDTHITPAFLYPTCDHCDQTIDETWTEKVEHFNATNRLNYRDEDQKMELYNLLTGMAFLLDKTITLLESSTKENKA